LKDRGHSRTNREFPDTLWGRPVDFNTGKVIADYGERISIGLAESIITRSPPIDS